MSKKKSKRKKKQNSSASRLSKQNKVKSKLTKSTQDSGLLGNLNHIVFWPPFLLLFSAIVLNFIAPDTKDADGNKIEGSFSKTLNGINDWILGNFGWMFTLCAVLAVTLCVVILFSSFGKVRIGGKNATPLMSMWNWFSITICTTIAIGILFWSTAEPISHYTAPPVASGIAPNTPEAAKFALSTMYLHWSFTPYALYCVCLLYTSPSPRDLSTSRMPSSA